MSYGRRSALAEVAEGRERMGNPSINKRLKQRQRQERQREKAAKR
jgi:hypothetical protein